MSGKSFRLAVPDEAAGVRLDAFLAARLPGSSRSVWKRFIEDATVDLGNVEVGIMSNLLVEFAKENGATAIIKGLRAISDFEYEFEMNQLNRKLAADIESMYIFASANYSFLSSTGVKEIATFGGDISDLVPEPVAKALAERLAR